MKKWKMKINWRKTKAMVVKRGGGTCNIAVNGVEIENVRTMKYLLRCIKDWHAAAALPMAWLC